MRNLNPKPFLYAIVGFSVIVWFILITISGFDINNRKRQTIPTWFNL